ncbi:DUF397 domain-containing protein [Longispora urticae]
MTTDLHGATWRKSSRSNGANQCIEIALLPQVAGVRDSKDQTGPALTFAVSDWKAFTAAIKADEF